MSFRFSDALRLSTVSIFEHKGRSAIVVLAVAVLFGVLMAANFLINGIEKTALLASQKETDGTIYITVKPSTAGDFWQYGGSNHDDIEWKRYYKKEMDPRHHDNIAERAKEYHGEVIGHVWNIHVRYQYYVATIGAVQDFIVSDLDNTPTNKVPVLVGDNVDRVFSEPEDQQFFEEHFYVVGKLPKAANFYSPEYAGGTVGWPTMSNENLLNVLLKEISGGFDYPIMLIDDGTGKVDEFFTEQIETSAAQDELYTYAFGRPQLVVKFNNVKDVLAYRWPNGFLKYLFGGMQDKYTSDDFFGGVLVTAYNFNMLRTSFLVIEGIIIVVAVVIATLTFRHLIDQEANTIALYRSMGATTRDIYLIYFLYLVELVLLSVVVCFVIAFLIIGMITLLNYAELSTVLQQYYDSGTPPKLYFYAFDKYCWAILVANLMVAPLALGFSTRCFSPKHVAKKLKSD